MDQQVTLVYIQGMIHDFKLFIRQEIIGLPKKKATVF